MVHLSHRIRKLQLSGYYLEKVLTHKEAIRRVGRTAQVKNRHWPVKSTKIVLDLLDNAEGNAEVKGLDVISHIQVKSSSEANTPNLPSPSKGKPYVCDVIYQNGTGHNYTDMIFPHDFPSIIERAKFGKLEGLVAKAERVYDGNIRVRMLYHVFGGGVCLYGFWSREQQKKVFQKHMSAMKLKIEEMKVADSKHSSDIEHLTKNDEKLAKEVDQLKTEDRKLATEVEGVTKGLIPCIIRLTPSTEHFFGRRYFTSETSERRIEFMTQMRL